jgi:hypothetical protein
MISDGARKRLKKVIKKMGLVEPPVWNKRTGNLVGGHQRLDALDALERSDDYYLDVAVIDVSQKEEVETNIALNNDSIMGEYDLDKLEPLASEYDLNFKNLGFTDADLDLMFDGELDNLLEDTEDVQKAKNKLSEIKKDRKKAGEKFDQNMEAEFYFVVVCESNAEKEKILKRLKVPVFETYVGAYKLMRALK